MAVAHRGAAAQDIRLRALKHAIEQCDRAAATYGQRRHSPWKGDAGVALFLQGCRMTDDAYPTLDVF